MDKDAAEQLARFRNMIAGTDLRQLTGIIATTLDELIDVLRRVEPGNYGVELAAALSAELHKRQQPQPPRPTYAPTVGNA